MNNRKNEKNEVLNRVIDTLQSEMDWVTAHHNLLGRSPSKDAQAYLTQLAAAKASFEELNATLLKAGTNFTNCQNTTMQLLFPQIKAKFLALEALLCEFLENEFENKITAINSKAKDNYRSKSQLLTSVHDNNLCLAKQIFDVMAPLSESLSTANSGEQVKKALEPLVRAYESVKYAIDLQEDENSSATCRSNACEGVIKGMCGLAGLALLADIILMALVIFTSLTLATALPWLVIIAVPVVLVAVSAELMAACMRGPELDNTYDAEKLTPMLSIVNDIFGLFRNRQDQQVQKSAQMSEEAASLLVS